MGLRGQRGLGPVLWRGDGWWEGRDIKPEPQSEESEVELDMEGVIGTCDLVRTGSSSSHRS